MVALASLGLALVLLVFRNQIGNGIDNLSTTVQSAPQSPYVPGGGPTAGRGRGGGVGGGQGSGRGAGS